MEKKKMTEKVEEIAKALDQCDKEALKQIAKSLGKLQRWYIVPWDDLYGTKRITVPTKAVVEEQSVFKVTLIGFDSAKKINLIREVQANTSLLLMEVKQLVEASASEPRVIKDGLSKADAEMLKGVLETSGGKVEMT